MTDKKTGVFVIRNQVTVFLGISFTFSWTIWFLSRLLNVNDSYTKLVITLIGAYGPSLAAILVTNMSSRAKTNTGKIKQWIAFSLIFLAVNLLWLVSAEKFGPFNNSNMLLLSSKLVLAFLVAFVVSGIFSNNKGTRSLLLPLIDWRVKPVWVFFVFFGFPILILASLILAVLLNAPFPPDYYNVQLQPWNQILPGIILAFIQTMIFQGPLNEEIGWRGFALPKLQKAHGSIRASIFIGLIWALWHTPLYYTGIYSGFKELLGRFFWHIPLSFLFTWIYNRTKGSLLMTILLHTSINFQGDITDLVLKILLR